MVWFKAFIAGFLATLVFHQGLFMLFYLGGALVLSAGVLIGSG